MAKMNHKFTILVLVLSLGVSLVWGATVNVEPNVAFGNTNYEYVDGVCGKINNCLTGIFSYRRDSETHHKWVCYGIGSGKDLNCMYPKPFNSTPSDKNSDGVPVDGVCGKINNCLTGIFSYSRDSEAYHRWVCYGINGGKDLNCMYPKPFNSTPPHKNSGGVRAGVVPVDGVCGKINNCLTGIFQSHPDSEAHYIWACYGINEGKDLGCIYPKPFNSTPPHTLVGVCGDSPYTCLVGGMDIKKNYNNSYLWRCADVECKAPQPLIFNISTNSYGKGSNLSYYVFNVFGESLRDNIDVYGISAEGKGFRSFMRGTSKTGSTGYFTVPKEANLCGSVDKCAILIEFEERLFTNTKSSKYWSWPGLDIYYIDSKKVEVSNFCSTLNETECAIDRICEPKFESFWQWFKWFDKCINPEAFNETYSLHIEYD